MRVICWPFGGVGGQREAPCVGGENGVIVAKDPDAGSCDGLAARVDDDAAGEGGRQGGELESLSGPVGSRSLRSSSGEPVEHFGHVLEAHDLVEHVTVGAYGPEPPR